ncbi:MAG: DUF2341 domain-containing protein [Spirochaetes bacterium]|nr:DUF2341 domain-containing protein [Spirochaetota bacterium]
MRVFTVLFWFSPVLMADPLGVWFNSNWAMRIPLTNISPVNGATLQDFPVLVQISNRALLANATANGDDLTFVDQFRNQLFHEIESFDRSGGSLTAWVCVPNLGPRTLINLYLSNTNGSYTFNGGNTTVSITNTLPTLRTNYLATNVWDSNFQLVLHFNETGTNAPIDSTRYGRVPVSYWNAHGSNNTCGVAGGPVGGCLLVDSVVSNSSSGVIPLRYAYAGLPKPFPAPNYPYSYSFWLNHKPVSNYITWPGQSVYTIPLTHGGNGGGGYGLFRINSNNFIDAPQVNGLSAAGNLSYPGFNSWQYFGLSGLVTNTNGVTTGSNFLVNNGQVIAKAAGGLGTNYTGDLYIGSSSGGGVNNYAINGRIDEFRWSTTNRSVDWLNTEYAQQANPAGVFNIAPPEYYGTARMTARVLTAQGAGIEGVLVQAPETMLNHSRYTDFRGVIDFGVVASGVPTSLTAFPPAGLSLLYTRTNFTTPGTDFTIDFIAAQTNSTNEISLGAASWFHLSGEKDLFVSIHKTNSATERVLLSLLPITGNNKVRIIDQLVTGNDAMLRVASGEMMRLVTMGTWVMELRIVPQGKDENDFSNPIKRKVLILTK